MSEKNAKSHKGSYIVLQDWMTDKLGLKGVELIVYAIIFGFSQDGVNCFTSSTRYLCRWTGRTKETVIKILKSLREQNLIERKKKHISNGSGKATCFLCDYWATITRFPADDQEKILDNWTNFSAAFFPQSDE